MRTIRTGLYPTGRLHTGTAILAAAELVDATLIKARLDAFASAHAAYAQAQDSVESAEAQLLGRQTLLNRLDAQQDETLEDIARVLVAEKQPRVNPFATISTETPTTFKRLNFGEKSKAIQVLAANVQADPQTSEALRRAAQAASTVAQQMETDLEPFEKLQTNLRAARDGREAAGKAWDNALRALKRGAHAAQDEGAPNLYVALFGQPRAAKRKEKPASDASPPTTDQPAATETTPPKAA